MSSYKVTTIQKVKRKNKTKSVAQNVSKRVPRVTVGQGYDGEVTVVMPLTRQCRLFPDRYFACGRVIFDQNLAPIGTSGFDSSYKSNIFGNQCTYQTVADAWANGAGISPFSVAAVPSGMNSLLGSPQIGGALHPFSYYRIHSSKIKVTYIPDIDSQNANCRLAVFPSITDDQTVFDSLNSQTITEQRYCKYVDMTAISYNKPFSVTNEMTTLKIAGDHYGATMESSQFDITPGTTYVVKPWLWNISVTTLKSSVTQFKIGGSLSIEIVHDIEFFNNNQLSSLDPV